MTISFTQDGGCVTFAIKVVPGASRDRIAGEYDGGLKVTVAKAASEGAANRAVIKLLASALDLGRNQIDIIRGHASPRKTIRVHGLSVEQVRERLHLAWRSSRRDTDGALS